MNDLISRQAAIDALHKKRIETMEKGQDVNHIWECLDVVAQVPSEQPEHLKELKMYVVHAVPTADVVEVVRCKDCKFTRCGGDERNGILYFCSQDCKAKKSNDFCSYGERAEA